MGRGLIEKADDKEMLAYQHSGFSVDAGVCIQAHDRAALERLLRYCARPPFAMERLRNDAAGTDSPHCGAGATAAHPSAPEPVAPPKRSKAHYLWAVLIARIYEVFPLLCPMCGGQMRLIAFIAEGAQIRADSGSHRVGSGG